MKEWKIITGQEKQEYLKPNKWTKKKKSDLEIIIRVLNTSVRAKKVILKQENKYMQK